MPLVAGLAPRPWRRSTRLRAVFPVAPNSYAARTDKPPSGGFFVLKQPWSYAHEHFKHKSPRIHADRIDGCRCDHWHPCGDRNPSISNLRFPLASSARSRRVRGHQIRYRKLLVERQNESWRPCHCRQLRPSSDGFKFASNRGQCRSYDRGNLVGSGDWCSAGLAVHIGALNHRGDIRKSRRRAAARCNGRNDYMGPRLERLLELQGCQHRC